MHQIIHIIHLLFFIYTLMILIRIFGSWFPHFQHSRFMQFIAHYTDPYLHLFRRFIPPIGGVLDLSPLIAFVVLRLAEKLLIKFLYVLF